MTTYWKTGKDSIIKNMESFKNSSTDINAKKLVNSVNAISGVFRDFDMSSVSPELTNIFKKASELTAEMDGIFRPSQFAPILKSLNVLNASFGGTEELINSIRNGLKVESMSNKLQKITNQLVYIQNRLSDIESELAHCTETNTDHLQNEVNNLNCEVDRLKTEIDESLIME